jgi:hypothetical protein
MSAEPKFESYLERIGDELLESVAADLAGLEKLFEGEPPAGEFLRRREACRSECIRRHRPDLFRRAETILHPAA